MSRLPAGVLREATIDVGAIAANVRHFRRLTDSEVIAVVKADGYGHGAAELGAVFVAHGADALAVADMGEGIRLRQRGITAPILVYPSSLPEAAPDALGTLEGKIALTRASLAYMRGDVGRAQAMASIAATEESPPARALAGMMLGAARYFGGDLDGAIE